MGSVCGGARSGCITVDKALQSDLGFEKLYESHWFVVYYDPIATQCIAMAHSSGGLGIDTFACNPDELRQRAGELQRK